MYTEAHLVTHTRIMKLRCSRELYGEGSWIGTYVPPIDISQP